MKSTAAVLASCAVAAVLALSLPGPVAGAPSSGSSSGLQGADHWVALPAPDAHTEALLIRDFDVRSRFGEHLLAVANDAEVRQLRRRVDVVRDLGEVIEGERLWWVALEPGEQPADVDGTRRLLLAPDAALVAVAADGPNDPHELLPPDPRPAFHEGLVPVPLQSRRVPASRPLVGQFSGGGAPAGLVYDPRIQSWVDLVDRSALETDVTYLSTQYPTRRSDRSDGVAAMQYLEARFQALGLTTTLFDFDGGADNVIAELPGDGEPDKLVIVGAHYDSYSRDTLAPGADDNASGSAAVLDIARILSQSGASFHYTIQFVLFAAEEFGLVGSTAYANYLFANGVTVVAMLNTDMNCYLQAGDAYDLDMVTDDTTPWLNDLCIQISNLYVPGLGTTSGRLGGGTSDHRPFFQNGYPAVFYFEDTSAHSPYIHTDQDLVNVSANSFDLSRDITKAVLAGVAVMAEPRDLKIDHTGLADTEDQWNPLVATAEVTSLIGTIPQTVDIIWDTGGSETTTPMIPSGDPDEWIGQIPAQATGTEVSYRLLATDDMGYQQDWPGSGGKWSLIVGKRDVLYFEDFESGDGGWTHGGTEDDWQLGTPMGLSTDPASAYSGSNVFGNDRGDTGWNGEYRARSNNWLRSPAIDATGWSGLHLRYARWLGVEDGAYDQAIVSIYSLFDVWENPTGSGSDHFIDTGWVLHDLDIGLADNQNPVRINFQLQSDAGFELGGWNVDDVELYSLAAGDKPTLHRDSAFLSLLAGGTTNLELDLGPTFANRDYAFLASISGTSPGFDISGVHVDLNWDAVTRLFLRFGASIPGFFGTTDGTGQATATLTMPAGQDPALQGTVLYFAALTLGSTDTASNSVEVLLVQ